MSLLQELRRRKGEILPILERYRARRPRVFGSVARERETLDSDIDVLVDLPDDLTLFDIAQLQVDLEDLLRRRVDLATEAELDPGIRTRALRDAVPL